MKKQYFFIPVFLALFVALPVLAQEVNLMNRGRASTTPLKARSIDIDRGDIEAKRASTTLYRENRRDYIKNNIEQRKASSTDRRVEMQRALAKRKIEHVKKVILATIERLDKIIARIELRITKIKERGGNTLEAESFIALAKEDLLDAREALDAFANLDISSDKAVENFATIRAAVLEAKEHIRSAHENMKNAVRLIKGPNTGNSTTTPASI